MGVASDDLRGVTEHHGSSELFRVGNDYGLYLVS
jgi:hypothetical protein